MTDSYLAGELWSLESYNISPRSNLHCLEPIGVSTPYVESLTSYIARLAESHNVALGILISKEIKKFLGKIFVKDLTGRGLSSLFDRASTLNGTGEIAKDLVDTLEFLTLRDDLRFLTLLSLSEVVPSRNLFRSQRAWCSRCFEEWYLDKQVIYEPLVWTISAVKVCLFHSQKLDFCCPYCKNQLPLLAWRTQPGFCSTCQKWLGTFSKTQSPQENITIMDLERETWIANTVGEVLSNIPHFYSLPRENIAKSLRSIIDTVTEGNIAGFARQVNLPKNTVWEWYSGKSVPRFEAVLEICYGLQVPLLNFLRSELSFFLLFQEGFRNSPQTHKAYRAELRPFDSDKVKEYLLSILLSEESPPPSMQEVATRLGCDKRTIHRHFSSLCQTISRRYLDHKKLLRLQMIELTREEVKQATIDLHKKGEYPSEARVAGFLSNPGYLRYDQVRKVLNETRQKLGLRN